MWRDRVARLALGTGLATALLTWMLQNSCARETVGVDHARPGVPKCNPVPPAPIAAVPCAAETDRDGTLKELRSRLDQARRAQAQNGCESVELQYCGCPLNLIGVRQARRRGYGGAQ